MKKFMVKAMNVLRGQTSRRILSLCALFCICSVVAYGQAAGGFEQATNEIKGYIPLVRKLIYAVAGVVALVGAIQVFIKMNNGDQDVSKSIMMLIGACVFLVAAATALPLFF